MKGEMYNVNEENRPSYYAIIPSNVRYCEELKYPERLLYGEITALAGKEGYCFATNKYFAELYHVIPGTISRWINTHKQNVWNYTEEELNKYKERKKGIYSWYKETNNFINKIDKL